MVMGAVLVFATIFVVMNVVADLLYAVLDPAGEDGVRGVRNWNVRPMRPYLQFDAVARLCSKFRSTAGCMVRIPKGMYYTPCCGVVFPFLLISFPIK